jgi:hypothetical protein
MGGGVEEEDEEEQSTTIIHPSNPPSNVKSLHCFAIGKFRQHLLPVAAAGCWPLTSQWLVHRFDEAGEADEDD